MYQLYYQPGTASMAVHWLLLELQLEHELRLVDFSKNQQKSPAYLKVNPSGVVPTLVFNGQPMTEFAAICMYLADLYSNKKMAPSTNDQSRPLFNQWMFFISNTMQPAFRLWFYPAELRAQNNSKLALQKRIEGFFERAEQHLSDDRAYFLGANISVLDLAFTMMMRWSRNMPKPADQWPALGRYAKRLKNRESFKLLCQREGLTDWL